MITNSSIYKPITIKNNNDKEIIAKDKSIKSNEDQPKLLEKQLTTGKTSNSTEGKSIEIHAKCKIPRNALNEHILIKNDFDVLKFVCLICKEIQFNSYDQIYNHISQHLNLITSLTTNERAKADLQTNNICKNVEIISSPVFCTKSAEVLASKIDKVKNTGIVSKSKGMLSDKISSSINSKRNPIVAHFLCQVCGKQFKSTWTQKLLHSSSCSKSKTITCEICLQNFKDKWNLLSHLKFSHKLDTKSQHVNEMMNRIFTVPTSKICSENTNQSLVRKEICKKKSINMYCLTCQKSSKKSPLVRKQECRHCKDHLKFQCSKCDKIYNMYQSIIQHQLNICGAPFLLDCFHCTFQTPKKIILKIHIHKNHMHVGPKHPNECLKCGEKIKMTQRAKSGSRKLIYECLFCNFKSEVKAKLISHNSVHKKAGFHIYDEDDDTPRVFKCEFCPAAFNLKYSIEIHLSVNHKINMQSKDGKKIYHRILGKKFIAIASYK